MIDKKAVLHIPCSGYAFASGEDDLCLRLRAARGNLTKCEVFFADRAVERGPAVFFPLEMELAAQSEEFDFFEARFKTPFSRVCYYFRLSCADEWIYYYGGFFSRELADFTLAGRNVDNRSEYFNYPVILRSELAQTPDWLKAACVYNVFPDSFASEKKGIRLTHPDGRLGGTLRGVTENLEHIASLGCDCLYLNPVFHAKSYHAYDTIDYMHVDPRFGTDDDLRELVRSAHALGIRVILDGVFNHSGRGFFAFQDVVKRGAASPYRSWFYAMPAQPEAHGGERGRPNYACFAYVAEMPKLNTANPEVQAYFAKVGRHWIEEFGIDGWRLDVANEVAKEFWRVFRREVKAAKPDCVLIGEVWENAQDWLRYDLFDSTMNYDFRRHCRDFFAMERIDAAQFDARVTDLRMRYADAYWRAQLNLLDSHDVNRFLSLCGGDERKMRLAVLFQMLFPGAPSIYYGDEMGLTGATEEEYRRPMPWGADSALLGFYREAIRLRRKAAPQTARFRTLRAEPGSRLYAYALENGAERTLVYLNAGERPERLELPAGAEIVFSGGLEHGALGAWGFAVARGFGANP